MPHPEILLRHLHYRLGSGLTGTLCATVFFLILTGSGGLDLRAQDPQQEGPNLMERAGWNLREAMQQLTIPRSRLTDGPHVRAAFRKVIEESTAATVRVLCKSQEVAVGGIVGPDGWILTKASRLEGPITVHLKDGREFDADLVGVQDDYDLAMLKIDAHDLPILHLARKEQPEVGQWVVTPGTGRDPLAIGVVSVGPREIPKQSGILGVQIGDSDAGPRVERVIPNSGAEKAGILVNDVILSINGKPIENRTMLTQTVRQYSPGETIEMEILRGQKKMTFRAILSAQVAGMRPDRGAMQNSMGSLLSERRYGFPMALQHDTVLKPIDCGGPLVNLDGQTIAFNIARGGRTESYAIPTPVVLTLLYDLMSGNLAPHDPMSRQITVLPAVGNPDGYPPEPE